jgi:hypothetical protein
MREELLAHLSGIFEEEKIRLGNDAAALTEATRRFGDPAELTQELQATVPAPERFLAKPLSGSGWELRTVRWFLPRPDESAAWHAARVAAVVAGYAVALLLMVPAVQYMTGVSWSAVRVEPAALAVIAGHSFLSAMLCVGFYRAACCRLSARSLLVAVACGVPLLAGGPVLFAVLTAVQPDNPLLGADLPHAGELTQRHVLGGLFWLAVSAVVFRGAFSRNRRVIEWMELKIDG